MVSSCRVENMKSRAQACSLGWAIANTDLTLDVSNHIIRGQESSSHPFPFSSAQKHSILQPLPQPGLTAQSTSHFSVTSAETNTYQSSPCKPLDKRYGCADSSHLRVRPKACIVLGSQSGGIWWERTTIRKSAFFITTEHVLQVCPVFHWEYQGFHTKS